MYKGVKFVKLWTGWINSSTYSYLLPEERGVMASLLCLAAQSNPPGIIRFHNFALLGARLQTPEPIIASTLNKLVECKTIDISEKSPEKEIIFLNWDTYQPHLVSGEWQNAKHTNLKEGEKKQINEPVTLGESKEPDVKIPDNAKAFLLKFAEKFKVKFNEEYPVSWGKDGKIIKDLLKLYGGEKLEKLMDLFFLSEDEFINKSGFSVGVFKSQIPKLIARPFGKYTGAVQAIAEWEKEFGGESENGDKDWGGGILGGKNGDKKGL